jgi:uncharacterized protein YabN with tetrapyrrole methylase and pyrophosphatase domain
MQKAVMLGIVDNGHLEVNEVVPSHSNCCMNRQPQVYGQRQIIAERLSNNP